MGNPGEPGRLKCLVYWWKPSVRDADLTALRKQPARCEGRDRRLLPEERCVRQRHPNRGRSPVARLLGSSRTGSDERAFMVAARTEPTPFVQPFNQLRSVTGASFMSRRLTWVLAVAVLMCRRSAISALESLWRSREGLLVRGR